MLKAISIITPSFNQARFLPECLDSVRDQTYPGCEHLVYDPGSTDDSRDIARSYPHVRLFAEADAGQSDAVNKGFASVTSDVVGWLNSDDVYYDLNVFRQVIDRFNQPDQPEMVYGAVFILTHRARSYATPTQILTQTVFPGVYKKKWEFYSPQYFFDTMFLSVSAVFVLIWISAWITNSGFAVCKAV